MITIYLKTWRCSTCNFAYSGAIPPTKAQWHTQASAEQDPTSSPFFGLGDYECPNCHTPTLVKVTDPKLKSVHRHLEQSDIDELRNKLEKADTLKIADGMGIREETVEEAESRAFTENSKDKTPRLRNLPIYRDETPEEKTERIDKAINGLRPISAEELATDREYFEDK